MAVLAAIAFAAFLLENDDVFTLYQRLNHLGNYFGTFNGRCAYCNSAVGINEEHFVEFDSIAFFLVLAEEVNEQALTGLSLELLSLNLYDCVHFKN